MKTITVSFTEEESEFLEVTKGILSWREFILNAVKLLPKDWRHKK